MNDDLRHRIAMTRVVCILGMIYVHVPTGHPDSVVYALSLAQWGTTIQGFLIEGIGRASAALLSIVSGYLTAVALSKQGATSSALYRRRFESIIVPMILWGAITIAVYGLISLTRETFLNFEHQSLFSAALTYVNFVAFLTDIPVGPTMHLSFLRDLFVCILLSPLLVFVLRRAAIPVLVALAFLYLADIETFVILRPLVLFAFAIGLHLALSHARMELLDDAWPLWLLLSAVATISLLLYNGGAMSGLDEIFQRFGLDTKESFLYPLSRVFGALAIWTVLSRLVGTRWQGWIESMTPYLFAAYCSHYLMLTLMWFGLWQPAFGSDRFYMVWFLAAPLVTMLVAWSIVNGTAIVWPNAAARLTGGRVNRPLRESKPVTDRPAIANAGTVDMSESADKISAEDTEDSSVQARQKKNLARA
ncbi:MAG: acyltransferase [Granulosicoccus sp.]